MVYPCNVDQSVSFYNQCNFVKICWGTGTDEVSDPFTYDIASDDAGRCDYINKKNMTVQQTNPDEFWIRDNDHTIYLKYSEVSILQPTDHTTQDQFINILLKWACLEDPVDDGTPQVISTQCVNLFQAQYRYDLQPLLFNTLVGTSPVTPSITTDATLTVVGSTLTTITLSAGASAFDDVYNGLVLTMTSGPANGEIVTISDYDGATRVVTFAPALSILAVDGDTLTIVGQELTHTVDGATLTTIQLDAGASALDDIYNGMTLTMTNGPANGHVSVISDYDGTTKIVTLATPLTIFPTNGDTLTLVGSEVGARDLGTVTSTTVFNLDAGANAVDDYYNGWTVTMTSGAANTDVRTVLDYNGTTKEITLSVALSALPATSDTLDLTFTDATRTVVAKVQTTSVFTLDGTASAIDDYYNGWTILMTNGPANTETSVISDYNGTTKEITLTSPFTNLVSDTNTFTLNFTDATLTVVTVTLTTIPLSAAASGTDDFYNGWYVEITDGAGICQIREITDYVGATQVLTLSPALTILPEADATLLLSSSLISINGTPVIEHRTTTSAAVYMDTSTSTISPSSSNNQHLIYQTKAYMPYQADSRMFVVVGATMRTTLVVNHNVARIGYYDDKEDKDVAADEGGSGIFFELRADGLMYACIRTYDSAGDVQTDTCVVQSDWNLDQMDGSGASAYSLDFTKAQLYAFEIEMNSSRIRLGFVVKGNVVWAHQFVNVNVVSEPQLFNYSLPIRAELINSGPIPLDCGNILAAEVTGDASMEIYSTSADLCGNLNSSDESLQSNPFNYCINSKLDCATVLHTLNDHRPLIAIRLDPTKSRATIWPKQIDIDNETGAMVLWRLILNPTGLTPGWASVGPNSFAQYSTSDNDVTIGVSGESDSSVILACGYMSTTFTKDVANLFKTFGLHASIDGNTPDVLALTVEYVRGSARVRGTMSWVETK